MMDSLAAKVQTVTDDMRKQADTDLICQTHWVDDFQVVQSTFRAADTNGNGTLSATVAAFHRILFAPESRFPGRHEIGSLMRRLARDLTRVVISVALSSAAEAVSVTAQEIDTLMKEVGSLGLECWALAQCPHFEADVNRDDQIDYEEFAVSASAANSKFEPVAPQSHRGSE